MRVLSIGFGSMASGQDGWLSETDAEALRRSGGRAVVQAGWAGLEGAGPDVLTIGDVPNAWLFPRVAAVVHHGEPGATRRQQPSSARAFGPRTGPPG